MLIDSHCHIHFPEFEKDRNEIIKRSFENGVLMITIGSDLETSAQALALAEKYQGRIWSASGIHPNDAVFKSDSLISVIEEVFKLAQKKPVVAIGETGLDFFRVKEKDLQKIQFENFEAHIDLANRLNKPMTIHIREAYQEAIQFLKSHRVEKGGAMHCFGGSSDQARQFLDLGFHISFAGNITYSDKLDETIRHIPMDRILAETDAPLLAPVPNRGKRNEPAYIEFVIKKISQLKNVDFGVLSDQIFENTIKAFQLNLDKK